MLHRRERIAVQRLSDLPEAVAQGLLRLPLPEFESTPWQDAKPLEQSRVALISSAGLHRNDDRTFTGGATDYRIIPGDLDYADLAMSHVSVNFDRSGFQQDVDVVFPLQRLRELAEAGEIGSVAAWHYSFMGATDPTGMVDSALDVARLLQQDGVDAALLVPI
jgi:D-proline reductase (dithiol) PrdB